MAENAPAAGKSMPLKINGRYENPWSTWKGLPSPWEVIKWRCTKAEHNTPDELRQQLPICKPEWQPTPNSGVIVTWLGHASVLVQIDGFTVLTDPIFSPRCSPISFYGPIRIRPPPCTVEELPIVNAVVISHNHYDHLDFPAVRRLHDRFGDELRFFVPMGLRSWFAKCGVSNVVELTWWNSSVLRSSAIDIQGRERALEIVFLPAQHWSLRSGFDRNLSLWGSWAVIGRDHRFYFAGDTGYCPEFRNIGAHYGPFDISAIPIGCYMPRRVMCNQHANPADAVQIHQDIRSKYSFGIHWGTYEMGSTEAPLAPKTELLKQIEKAGISPNSFFTLHHGSSWQLPDEPAPA